MAANKRTSANVRDMKLEPIRVEQYVARLSRLSDQALEETLTVYLATDKQFLRSLRSSATGETRAWAMSKGFKGRIKSVQKSLEGALEGSREKLYELICVKFKYCSRRAEGEVKLVCGIISALAGKGIILVAYPKAWVVPLIILYLYRNGFFDRLCKCKK